MRTKMYIYDAQHLTAKYALKCTLNDMHYNIRTKGCAIKDAHYNMHTTICAINDVQKRCALQHAHKIVAMKDAQ